VDHTSASAGILLTKDSQTQFSPHANRMIKVLFSRQTIIIMNMLLTDRVDRVKSASCLAQFKPPCNQALSPLLRSESSMFGGGWPHEIGCGFTVVMATEFSSY